MPKCALHHGACNSPAFSIRQHTARALPADTEIRGPVVNERSVSDIQGSKMPRD